MWLTAELTRAVCTRCTRLVAGRPVRRADRAAARDVRAGGHGATALTARRRPYDAAIFALSPLLVFHAFSNWDLLAMALASCGAVGVVAARNRWRPAC